MSRQMVRPDRRTGIRIGAVDAVLAAALGPQVGDRGGEGRERVAGIAELVEAQRLHVIFEIRRLARRIALGETSELRRRHGQRAALHQEILQAHADAADQAIGAFVQRACVLNLVDRADLQMILQILADARQLMRDADAERLQQLARADARYLHELRRADRARGQDHLARRLGIARDTVLHELDADRVLALEPDAARLSMRDDREVGPVQHGPQEGARRIPAHATTLIDVKIAAAFVVAAVEIVDLGDADLRRRLAERVEDFPRQAHRLDTPFAAAAVMRVGAEHVMLRALEIRQHIVPGPAQIALLPPAVEIARLAAHVDHAVDRGAAAQHAAARIIERAAVESGLGLRLEAPIGARIVLGVKIADRDSYPDVIVLAAGLEQQDGDVWIGGETVGQYAAGATRADDHIVEAADAFGGRDDGGHGVSGTIMPHRNFVTHTSRSAVFLKVVQMMVDNLTRGPPRRKPQGKSRKRAA